MNVSDCAANKDSDHSADGTSTLLGALSEVLWLNGGTAVLDMEGGIIFANDALAIWLGASQGELQGQSFAALMSRRSQSWEAPLREFLANSDRFGRLELAVQGKLGEQKISVESCFHQQARYVRLESVLPPMRDLEESLPEEHWGKAATHAVLNRLIRAEAQLDNLVQRWPGIIFSQRPDFSFSFVSPRIEALTGISPQEWRRQSKYFWQVVHEADSEALLDRFKVSDKSPDGVTSTYRVRHFQTGRVSHVWEHRKPVHSSNGLLLGYECIWLDITRQTLAERRLLSMAWKENLGTLTMGLAHDFCNLMTGIMAISETFEHEYGGNDSLKTALGMIRTSASQAGELTHRIRQLHQGVPGEKNYHDLNDLTSNLVKVLQKVLPKMVQIKSTLEPGQLPVYLDAVELRQVIVNLALNAADAMPKGGTLSFHTSRHESPPQSGPVQGRFPGPRLFCLSVQDTGLGIPPNYLNSIFDPFFTTKPLGKGSGLGLYNARLFAENNGVAISVESREREGTTFHLWFAQTDFSETNRLPEIVSPIRPTVLVIGAESEARNRMSELLRSNGCYAVPVAAESEALEAIHSPGYAFDGILTLCSRVQGTEIPIHQRVRAELPGVKTFLSIVGCNHEEFDTAFIQSADVMFPPDLSAPEMISRMRKALAQNSDGKNQ